MHLVVGDICYIKSHILHDLRHKKSISQLADACKKLLYTKKNLSRHCFTLANKIRFRQTGCCYCFKSSFNFCKVPVPSCL